MDGEYCRWKQARLSNALKTPWKPWQSAAASNLARVRLNCGKRKRPIMRFLAPKVAILTKKWGIIIDIRSNQDFSAENLRILLGFLLISFFLLSATTVHSNSSVSTKKSDTDKAGNHFPFPEKVRGINTNFKRFNPSVIEKLHQWNANALRVNIGIDASRQKNATVSPSILGDYSEAMQRIDSALPYCRKYKIGLIISLKDVPGSNQEDYWTSNNLHQQADYILSVWKALSKKYQTEPAVIAYDLFNEPQTDKKDGLFWLKELIPEIIQVIRNIDRSVYLVVEPSPWSMPKGFKNMQVYEDSKVVYSFHMYAPHMYTYQGIKANLKLKGKLTYPGILTHFTTSMPITWDKSELETYMQDAAGFQQKHKARVLVGEFGEDIKTILQ
jgi:hypothetical protein